MIPSPDADWTVRVYDTADSPQQTIDAASSTVASILMSREAEFGVHPSVTLHYPDLDPPASPAFFQDPAAYIDRLRTQGDARDRDAQVVVLTTYGDRLREPLIGAGYRAQPIDMPAGPDHTTAFFRSFSSRSTRTIYIEAANEADEKIRPTVVVHLEDRTGAVVGGACATVHRTSGGCFAYLSTMAVKQGLPPGAGSMIGHALLDALRSMKVLTVHLGTQTAQRFYEKLGFRVMHELVPALRVRTAGSGGAAFVHALVIMRRDL